MFYIVYRADTTNQSSLFDLNASLNSSVYRKRRRKSLFRVNNPYFYKVQYSSYILQSNLTLMVNYKKVKCRGEGYYTGSEDLLFYFVMI